MEGEPAGSKRTLQDWMAGSCSCSSQAETIERATGRREAGKSARWAAVELAAGRPGLALAHRARKL